MPQPARFSSLVLPSSLLEALDFEVMTRIQERTLPSVLAGRDVLAQAEPGSGKTIAFGLGMLAAVITRRTAGLPAVRALAACPTHELADQIATELRRLARRTPNVKVLTLCGGLPFRPQRASLKLGADVVVGTPGRLEEHLRKGSLQLDQLAVLVLDEADRMLDMGFAPQLEALARHAPTERQTLLFSATFPRSLAQLAGRYQRDPLHILVEPEAIASEQQQPSVAVRSALEERFHRVSIAERATALLGWIEDERPASTLVFVSTRLETGHFAEQLRAHGWVAASIHGELSQRERTHVVRLFKNESCSILVATDVAARGWDITGLSAVVNLGLPRDPSVYLHRIGRTGRSGGPGLAVSFVAEEDLVALAAIERSQGRAVVFSTLPTATRTTAAARPIPPKRVTLLLGAGKNKKLRPGDILGALTAEGGVRGSHVGNIDIDESCAYVAVDREVAEQALVHLTSTPIKGRTIKVRRAGLSLSSDEP